MVKGMSMEMPTAKYLNSGILAGCPKSDAMCFLLPGSHLPLNYLQEQRGSELITVSWLRSLTVTNLTLHEERNRVTYW